MIIKPIANKLHIKVGRCKEELEKPVKIIPHVTKQLTKIITLASKNIYHIGLFFNVEELLSSCIN